MCRVEKLCTLLLSFSSLPFLIGAKPLTGDASHKWTEVVLVEHIQVEPFRHGKGTYRVLKLK